MKMICVVKSYKKKKKKKRQVFQPNFISKWTSSPQKMFLEKIEISVFKRPLVN